MVDAPRTHGYSQKGHWCHGTCDWNKKGRINAIGALYNGDLITVGLFECSIDSDVFHAWVTALLLKKTPKNSVIIMDNASFHKRSDTQLAITQQGHTILFLPPYSPDFNPIEHTWAQVKAIRRKKRCDVNILFKELQ